MAMLMLDLYRNRPTDGCDPREAWLSTCLSELLDEDADFRQAFLAAVGHQTDSVVTVDHQRRYGSVGDSQIADVVLESDDLEVIIECKDRDKPKLAQMTGYARRSACGATIVLVAGGAAIERHASGAKPSAGSATPPST
jgi:hypothetical protein